jgi:hypothetical protein
VDARALLEQTSHRLGLAAARGRDERAVPISLGCRHAGQRHEDHQNAENQSEHGAICDDTSGAR